MAAAVGVLIWFDPVGRRRKAPSDTRVPPPIENPAQNTAPNDAGQVEPLQPDAALGVVDADPDRAPEAPLYTVIEALEDVAADPLVFVGTGEWFGNYSIHACAYRNARVIVVNVYCTVKEQPALGLVVLSPTRGRLMIYAEADSAISTLQRSEYGTFRAEVAPTLPDDPLDLAFTYAELRAWDERRYNAHAGGCWSGDKDGCSRALEPRFEAWGPSAKAFLANPPEGFYRLAEDLHARAMRDRRRSN